MKVNLNKTQKYFFLNNSLLGKCLNFVFKKLAFDQEGGSERKPTY